MSVQLNGFDTEAFKKTLDAVGYQVLTDALALLRTNKHIYAGDVRELCNYVHNEVSSHVDIKYYLEIVANPGNTKKIVTDIHLMITDIQHNIRSLA